MGLERHWYGPRRWLWLLWPLQALFHLLTLIRRQLYQRGVFSRYRAPVPVIVVGNITVGGTGKTPLVIALVEYLHSKHYRVGVVSRGYGAKAPSYPLIVSSNSDVTHCGDEPLLIHLRTGAIVIVDPKRSRAIEKAVALGCDIVVSDDGLQHYAFCRDIEIVVIDAVRQLGNGWLLPAGPLREPVSRLQSVDLIVCNGACIPALSEHSMTLAFDQWMPLSPATGITPPKPDELLHAFAGIGNPSRFFSQLRQANWPLLNEHPKTDHHRYQESDFINIRGPIVMTEKDAVKCRHLPLTNAWYVPVHAQLNDEFFQRLTKKLSQLSGEK